MRSGEPGDGLACRSDPVPGWASTRTQGQELQRKVLD